MKTIIRIIAVITLLFAFANCDPGKRIAKICAKHPGVCKRDTFTQIIKDSILIPEINVDTVFTAYAMHDTIYLQKDRLIMKYYHNPNTNQVYISGNVAAQTHVFEHRIQVISNEVTFKKDFWDYVGFICSFLGGVVIALPIIFSLIKKLAGKQ